MDILSKGFVLQVNNLHTHFFTIDGTNKALNGIDLTLEKGQMLGIVGETGTGKTVLLESILNLVRTPGKIIEGSVLFEGKDLISENPEILRQIRGNEISLITSNPRHVLDPISTVGEQIANVLLAHKTISKKEANGLVLKLMKKVEIPDSQRRFAAYPHELSGGMCQRIVIAMALANSPKLILADEPTSGLDVTVQKQILDIMKNLLESTGTSALIVTRDLGIVAQYCHNVATIYNGKIMETGHVQRFFASPLHPYSKRLMDVTLSSSGGKNELKTVALEEEGEKIGCSYAYKCPISSDDCMESEPELTEVKENYFVRCHQICK